MTEVLPGASMDVVSGHLVMFMQPVVQLDSGLVQRFEALARLVSDHGDVLLPAHFLPTLTDDGIDALFREGLDHVLAHLAEWQGQGLVTAASINISPTTLRDPQCASWVAAALERHGVSPDRLFLEILEDIPIDSEAQRDSLEAVRALGVASVMDDMGVGHSTLARLSEFPFLGAKIDRSYVAAMADNPVPTLSRIDALVRLARDVGWDLAVEGIETIAVGEAVVALGATRAQGYLFARPMPPDEVPDFIASFRSPVRTGQVTTALGALGHHWKVAVAPTAALHACPVSAFLDVEHAPAEIVALHVEVHESRDALAARRSLAEWLVRRAAAAS